MSSKESSRRWLRYTSIVFIALLLLSAMFIALLPPLLQYAGIKHLTENNLSDASIKNIDLNLFTGNFQLEELAAASNKYQGFSVASLILKLDVMAALHRTIHLEEMSSDSLVLNLQQTSDGNFAAGYQAVESKGDNLQTEKPEAYSDSSQAAWRLLIDSVKLNNTELTLHSFDSTTRIRARFDMLLQGLEADTSGSFAFSRVSINNLELFNVDHSSLQLSELQIDDLRLSDNNLSIESLVIRGLFAALKRLSNGEMHINQSLRQFVKTGDVPAVVQEEEETQVQEAFSWRLGSFVADGKNHIEFTDNVLSPPLKKQIAIENLKLSEIDSRQPGNTTIADMVISSDEREDLIHIHGSLSPLLQQPKVDLTLDFKHINLTDWSPYVAQAIGYSIRTGVLDLDASLKVAQNSIEVENRLLLQKLKLEVSDAQGAADFDKKMTLPLSTALNILQDSDGNIALEVPIDGSLDDPNFRLGSAVNVAIAEALKAASMSYLKYAIQPWGAALFVGEQLTGRLGKINFDPITFAEGESKLGSDALTYLDKLSKLLIQKSKLGITVCPKTGLNDETMLRKESRRKVSNEQIAEQLEALGNNRYQAIKGYMVDQHQIESRRIIKCLVEHTQNETGVVGFQL